MLLRLFVNMNVSIRSDLVRSLAIKRCIIML